MELLLPEEHWNNEMQKKFGKRPKKKPLREQGKNPRALGTNPRAKMKKQKSITIGKSESRCPRKSCAGEMVIRKHQQITPKLKAQAYYFSQWDYCHSCNSVWFDEKYKVLNSRGAEMEERQQQLDHFNNI